MNDRIFGKYCKNRLCTVCLSIRKAEIINKYLPIVNTWEDPHFVTLTIKAVKADRLKPLIENIMKGFRRIINKYKKRFQRGGGIKLMGIKSIESNFNPIQRTYNPHLHLIVPTKQIGDILITEWLKTPKKRGWTNIAAQRNIRITDKEKTLIEIVKYGSKIFTEPDVLNKSKSVTNRTIYAKALYTIFEAMQGHRIFDRFGFDLPKCQTIVSNTSTLSTQYQEYFYDPKRMDWIDKRLNLPLADYNPEHRISYLLENCIDKVLN